MLNANDLPRIIQGGMGIGVSGWQLARAVSCQGGLGVVSGTAIDTVMVRRLQLGDPGGHVRRALAAFPDPDTAEWILRRYFIEGGVAEHVPFKALPMPSQRMNRARLRVLIAANFVEVFLAKQGHDHPVGINYLEKIQLPTLPSLYGALLAGVDVILMGAGIPTAIPQILTNLLDGQSVELRLHVEGQQGGEPFVTRFGFADAFDRDLLALRRAGKAARPLFLPIVSSHVLAKTLLKKASGTIDGFVVESHHAGGHNAPPRRSRSTNAPGTWGPLDEPDFDVLRALGVPFWLAGGRASAAAFREALALGARGIQVGTAFAFCDESGIPSDVKRSTIDRCRCGTLHVHTDFQASPTGYPFKLILDAKRPDELERLRNRSRVCDLGYLRQNYVDARGRIGYRCPGEPRDSYVNKGGSLADTVNKLCLCNGLLATVGLGQRRSGVSELPIYTAGDQLDDILDFVAPGRTSYTARDVLDRLLGESPTTTAVH